MAVRDRYHLLSSVVRIANSPRLSPLARLKTIARFMATTFTCPVTFYILDNERRHFASRISSIRPAKAVNCLIPLGAGIVGLCAAQKAVLRRGISSLHSDEVIEGSEEEIVAIPITAGNDLCGVVTLGLTAGTVLSTKDQGVVTDILAVAAGIVEGMGSAALGAGRASNLAVLGELGQLLNRTVSPQELVPLFLRTCYERTGCCCAVVRLFPRQGVPTGVFRKSRRSIGVPLATLLEIEAAISAEVVAGDVPFLHRESDASTLPCLCVPIRFERNTLGTLTVFKMGGKSGNWRHFDAEERGLLVSMAVLFANALSGAANNQLKVQLDVANDTKLKELASLYRISNTMLSTIRLNKLIHLILTVLTSGPDPFFERAMLFLINERAGVMQGMLGVDTETSVELTNPAADEGDILASRWDLAEEDMMRQRDSEFSCQVRESRLPLNKSLNVASRAVLEKRLIHIPDAAKDKRVDREFVRRFGITSFATAPLLAKEKIVGVVIVDNPVHGKPLRQDELRFLQLFMNQAGMAIENSMLYNRIEDANRSLREVQEQLIQGERLATLGEMAARIAHELKGPLVSIGGFARRLEKKLSVTSTERGYAETIVAEVLRLEKMLTDILSFSKKPIICFSHCNIAEIVENALAIVAPALEQGGVVVRKKVTPRGVSFQGDCQQLKQVFINLFFNALEAMKSGGQLDIGIVPTRLNGQEAVAVKVADTGGGIPLETLGNIFNPFFTTKETGTGLGLPIANRIVTNHGGKIHVNNRPGIGVEFTVLLPMQS